MLLEHEAAAGKKREDENKLFEVKAAAFYFSGMPNEAEYQQAEEDYQRYDVPAHCEHVFYRGRKACVFEFPVAFSREPLPRGEIIVPKH